MPPRRGRGRKPVTPVQADNTATSNDAQSDVEMKDAPVAAESNGGANDLTSDPVENKMDAEDQCAETNGDSQPPADDVTYPYQVKVTHLPATFTVSDLQFYLASTFKVLVPKITSHDNNAYVKVYFDEKEGMESLARLLNNHVWKRKSLRAETWLPLENRKRKREEGGDDQEQKKNKTEEEDENLTLEDEILSESLPLLNVSEEDQTPKIKKGRVEKPWVTEEMKEAIAKTYKLYRSWKSNPTEANRIAHNKQRNVSSKIKKTAFSRYEFDSIWFVDTRYLEDTERLLTHQDVVLMSQRLHGIMCAKNPALAGWAEQSCEKNNGTLFQIDPVTTCGEVIGYRSKCKFRIGKNSEGQTVVGFCLNDNDTKILGVEPGDKLIHLPEIMKLAAQRMQEFVRESGKEPYDRKKKTGVWDNLLVRMAPDGRVLLVVVASPLELDTVALETLKVELKEFFTNGKGKDCNILSLYIHLSTELHVAVSTDKLFLLAGQPDFEETICGLRFHISPFSILNINPYSMEKIYESVRSLADPTPEHVVIDACAGSCGIAFSLAKYSKKVYAIEPQDQNVEDAIKTKALNKIENVEILKGKCEDKMEKIFADHKNDKLIVILDPPRHGVGIKVITMIRAQNNVDKVVYVCSNTKTGTKNLLELCMAEGKEPTTGFHFGGHPFLPKRVIPIDVAPFTVNNTVPILFERVDPSTFPAATKPPPEPMKRELTSKDKKKLAQPKKARTGRQRPRDVEMFMGLSRGRGVRGGRIMRGGPPRFVAPPLMRAPIRDLMGRGGPPRRIPPLPVPPGRYADPNVGLISKYERRIAEMEQQDRAFKAGLSMGLQAINRNSGVGGSDRQDMGDYSTGEGFGGYRGGYKDPYGENSSQWQAGPIPYSRSSFGNSGGFGGGYGDGYQTGYGSGSGSRFGSGSGFGGYGDGFGTGYGGPDRGRQNAAIRTNPLAGSRFQGVGDGRGGRGVRGGFRGARGTWSRR